MDVDRLRAIEERLANDALDDEVLVEELRAAGMPELAHVVSTRLARRMRA